MGKDGSYFAMYYEGDSVENTEDSVIEDVENSDIAGDNIVVEDSANAESADVEENNGESVDGDVENNSEVSENPDGTEHGNTEENAVTSAEMTGDESMFVATETVTVTDGEEEESVFYSSSGSFKYLYVDKDGNATQISPAMKPTDFVDSIGVLADGSALISLEGKVYKVDKATSELTQLCDGEEAVSSMKQVGNLLYMVGSTLKIYDLEANTFVEDAVLEEFCAERLNAAGSAYIASDEKAIVLCEGEEENSVYVACSDGLYRHVIGGNVMEEIMKGSLSSLGDPSLNFYNLVSLENEEFLINYYNRSIRAELLKHYVYDNEVAAVPEQTLEIYSLEENASIKQAVSDYQKNHSDVYIKYEVGLSEGSGMTKEDAIRNLNTELLSGEGPDIILLDGMPVESYMEKGILADLSGMLSENFEQDTFFENIVSTYKKDDKIYAIPTRFKLPVVYGDKAVMDGIMDLTTFADTIEKLRQEKESGSIAGLFNEKEVVEKLYDVNSPAWVAEDGTIKKEELKTFLTEAKRIYEAEQKGLSETEIKEHEEGLAFYKEYVGADYSLNAGNSAMDYLIGKQQIAFGRSNCVSTLSMDYSMIASVLDKKDSKQQIKLMPGQMGNVFVPNSVIGICENSASKELAMAFVSSLMSEDAQSGAVESGYPVNKAAFSTALINPQEEEESSMFYSMCTEDGDVINLDVNWIDEAEQKNLEEMVASLDTPSAMDETVKDAVLELAPAALNGEKTIDDVANEIVNKVQIYLSE